MNKAINPGLAGNVTTRETKMKRYIVKGFTVMAAVMFMSITVMELTAHARAGGSRSSVCRPDIVG